MFSAIGLLVGYLVLLIALWVPCAVFCGTIAEDKGHGGIAWFWAGLLFGPLGLIAVAGLSDRKLRRYIRLTAEKQGVDLSEAKPAGDVAKDIIKKKRGY